MSEYIVSARKYRPQLFEEVVGQESITHTLENAINNDHLAQAFLFCGPRGVGKTTCARILARVINTTDAEQEGQDFAFNIFELDAASNNSVDDIRNLIDQVRIPPQTGSYRVFIIDEVHMLSPAAFNAFLKTLEEPPPHAIFILATTEKHKILPTILSRCQVYDFRRIEVKDIVVQLQSIAEKEGVTASEDALHLIAQKADGAMRDALSIFDQLVSFSGNELTYEQVIENLSILDYDYFFKVMDFAEKSQISDALLLFNEILEKGFDGHHFVTGLSEHVRDLLVSTEEKTISLLTVGENIKGKYLEQSKHWKLIDLYKCLQLCNKCDMEYKSAKNQRVRVELLLMQLCSVKLTEPQGDTMAFKVEIEQPILVPFTEKKAAVKPIPVAKVVNKEVPSEKETPVSEVPKEVTSQAKPSKVARPKSAISRTGLSIKGVTAGLKNPNKKKGIEEIDTTGKPREPFTDQTLYTAWHKYLIQLKSQKRSSLHSTLGSREVTIKEGNVLRLVLDNEIQKVEIIENRSEMLNFLRAELNNYGIQLDLEVSKEEGEKKRVYTNRDRFEHMSEKNPALLRLQERLDLDVGY